MLIKPDENKTQISVLTIIGRLVFCLVPSQKFSFMLWTRAAFCGNPITNIATGQMFYK